MINVVLCLKLIWRVLSAKSLWIDWIHEYLIQQGSFWQIQEPTSGSWIWRKLLKYRSIAAEFHKMAIGNGSKVFFWFDHWCERGRLWYLLGERGPIDFGIPRNTLIRDIPSNRRRRFHRVQLLNQIEEEIGNLSISETSQDISLWRMSTGKYKQCFNTKDTWEQLREIKPKVNWHRGIWFKHHTPKFSFIAWVAIHNRLPTGERMRKWKSNISGECTFCNLEVESIDHLFFKCEFSSSIWADLMRNLMGSNYTSKWSDLLRLISRPSQRKVTQVLLRYGFQVAVYMIWRERNRRRHGESPMSKASVCSVIDSTIKNHFRSVRSSDPNLEEVLTKWMEVRQGAQF